MNNRKPDHDLEQDGDFTIYHEGGYEERFADIPKKILLDERLSFAEVGVYCWVYAQGEGYEVEAETLAKAKNENVEDVAKLVKALQRFGHVSED